MLSRSNPPGALRFSIGLCLLLLTSCGFQPIYAQGQKGMLATALQGIEVQPIPDRSGQILADKLRQQFGSGSTPRYRLDITLQEKIEPFGIRSDESATRARVSLVAQFKLTALASNTVLLQDSARSDVGIDKLRSEFATIAAEQSAAERNLNQVSQRISARIALFFQKNPAQ
jgi:LPS-assembly lipoprotein